MRLRKSSLVSASLVTLLGACTDVPNDAELLPPKGVMMGTVTYVGPMPCSQNGEVVGNAILTLFNESALPPPAGLGLSAHRIAVVPGEVLFAGVAHRIPINANGERLCPEPGTTVHVSAPFEVGPIEPGVYQLRGWYDWDGDWHAAFKFANMVTKGDIAGGAIANLTEALAGHPVRYERIEIGVKGEDGIYRIPELGYIVRNVSPVLAAPITTNRPYFHVSKIRKGRDAQGVPDPLENPSGDDLVMPADYRLFDASVLSVHDSLPRLGLRAGLPDAETSAATRDPFFFHLEDPLFLQRYDANNDGKVDAEDHISGTVFPVTALGPIVSLTKIDRENDPTNLWRATQNIPRVLTSLVVTPTTMPNLMGLMNVVCSGESFPVCVDGKCCEDITGGTCDDASECYDHPVAATEFNAYLRPSAVCIEDPSNPSSKTVIVTPHEFDQQQKPNRVIADEESTKNDIARQLNRDVANVEIAYGCLPPGKFALNVIYPSTGQAWTVPNESGICMPGEAPGDGTCGKRARLPSQFRTFDIGPAQDPGYCQGQRQPLTGRDPIRDHCLTAKEKAMYIEGTLWGGPPNPL